MNREHMVYRMTVNEHWPMQAHSSILFHGARGPFHRMKRQERDDC